MTAKEIQGWVDLLNQLDSDRDFACSWGYYSEMLVVDSYYRADLIAYYYGRTAGCPINPDPI